MYGNDSVRLTRDVEANLVPSGYKITLKKGELVRITQALGGSYTVLIQGNMAQVASSNADALGKEAEGSQEDSCSAEQPFHEQLVWDQLKTCYDPEIPIDLWNLGLIYHIEIKKKEEDRNLVKITKIM